MTLPAIYKTREFDRWFESLRDNRARARILARIRRLSLGNFGDTKALGGGLSELRIDYGPGYRIYFASHGVSLLLANGVTNPVKNPILPGPVKSRLPGSPKMGDESSRWDAADYLDNPEAIAGYLEAIFEEGDPDLIAAALNDVARAKGLAQDALNASTDLSSLIRTMKALGLELSAKAA